MKTVKYLLSMSVLLLASIQMVQAASNDTLFPIVKDKKWGYINSSGKIVVAPKYDHASVFAEGRGMVTMKKPVKKIHCIDATGKVVFEAPESWADMNEFSYGLAVVKDKATKLYGYVDLNGKQVIPFKFSSAGDFSEGLAKVEIKDGKDERLVGFINTKGEMAFAPDKWLKGPFSDGMAHVRMEKDGRFVYGYIDKSGKMVIEPRFKKVGKFGEGLAYVVEGDKVKIIDKKGRDKVTFDFKVGSFDKLPKYSHGFANLYYSWKFPTGFWGFVDKAGKLAFPKMDITLVKTPFSEERAWIKLRGSNDMVLIDTKGKQYVKVANVQDALEFKNGLSAVILKKEKNIYYYDRNGKLIWK